MNFCNIPPLFPSISSFPTLWSHLCNLTLTHLNSFAYNLWITARQQAVKILLETTTCVDQDKGKQTRRQQAQSRAMNQGTQEGSTLLWSPLRSPSQMSDCNSWKSPSGSSKDNTLLLRPFPAMTVPPEDKPGPWRLSSTTHWSQPSGSLAMFSYQSTDSLLSQLLPHWRIVRATQPFDS